jgi:hypothetical protein
MVMISHSALSPSNPTTDLELALYDPKAFSLATHALGSAVGVLMGTAIRCWREQRTIIVM